MAAAKRIRSLVRPTSQGWGIATVSGLFLSSLLWPGHPLAFALGLALLVALATAMVVVPRRLRGIRGRWVLPKVIHAGEEITVGAVIQATAGSAPVSLGAWDPCAGGLTFITDLPGLSPTPTRCAWVVRFPERGVVELPPLVLRNEQPFGLLAAQRPISDPETITVRPAIGRMERDIIEQLRRWLDDGANTDELGDDDIAYLRPYRPGDPLRRINWRISARSRQLMVTQRQAPATHRLAIVLDTTCRAARSRRFERLVCVAATLIDHLDRLGWTIVLHGDFAPDGLHGDRERLLDALAMVAPQDEVDLAALLPQHDSCLMLCLDERPDLALDARTMVLTLDRALEHMRIPRMQL